MNRFVSKVSGRAPRSKKIFPHHDWSNSNLIDYIEEERKLAAEFDREITQACVAPSTKKETFLSLLVIILVLIFAALLPCSFN